MVRKKLIIIHLLATNKKVCCINTSCMEENIVEDHMMKKEK